MKHPVRVLLVLTAAMPGLLLVSCGNGTDVHTLSGPTQFSGRSARFSSGPWTGVSAAPDGGPPMNEFVLLISDVELPCDSRGLPPSVDLVGLVILTSAPEQVTVGTYQLSGFREDWLWYYSQWRGLPEPYSLDIDPGRLDLRRLDDSGAEGSVDLTLTDGTRLGGGFSARRCP
jgi:hypothetical protein